MPSEMISVPKEKLDLLKFKSGAYENLSRFIDSGFHLEDALNYTLDIIIDLFGAQSGSLMLLDSSKKVMNFNVVRGENAQILKDFQVPVGEGIAGKVVKTGNPIIVNNTQASPDFDGTLAQKINYTPSKILCVPLKVKSNTYGIIEIMDKKNNTDFSELDLDLLQSLASPLSIMIENITLFKLTEEDVHRLKTLMKVNKVINTTMDLQDLLEYIMNAAKEILKSEGSSLLLIDEEKKELYFNIVEEDRKAALQQIRVPLGMGIAGIVAKTGEPLLINDARNDPRVFRKADEATSIQTRNILCVPMKVRDKIIGVLEVINSYGGPFYNEYDLSLFQAMAEQAGIAIHNRNLIANLQTSNLSLEKRVKELSAINRISNYMSKNFEYKINDILTKIIRSLSDILEIERISIFILNSRTRELEIMDAVGIPKHCFSDLKIPLNNRIMGHVFNSGVPLLCADISHERQYGRYKKLRYKTPSFICTPIRLKNRIIGVINFSDKKNRTWFDEEDLQTLETISIQISEAYENSLFYSEIMEKQRIEKELEIANNIQQSILPKTFPASEFLDVAAASIPALEIGGDFYDYIQLDDNQIAAYIADVSGKGIPASLFMALSRSIMRIQALDRKYPSSTLDHANKFILADSKKGMFVTLFYCFLDHNNHKLHFGCAGHNEQIYYSNAEDEIRLIKTKGVPLGILPSPFFSEEIIDFKSGDLLVMYTDGVLEAINAKEEEFGTERLKEIIRQHKNSPCQVVLQAIQSGVKEFIGDVKQFDDLTIMILRFK